MNGIVPAPIAALPWRVIFILSALVGFGATVLYSAAGGNFEPWAGKHVIRFVVLLAMAIAMSRMKLEFWKSMTFPLYLLLLVLLVVVQLMGFVGGGELRGESLGFFHKDQFLILDRRNGALGCGDFVGER